jgi:hypothetical protein
VPESVISYVPRTDVTPGGELNALAVVYKFVVDCHTKKEEAALRQGSRPTSDPNSAREKHRGGG